MRSLCLTTLLLALYATAALAVEPAAPASPAAAAAATSTATATAAAEGVPEKLDLAEALRLFRARGFDLMLADAQVASAQGDLRAAGASPNPELSGGFTHATGYDASKCAGCSANGFSVGLSDQGALSDLLFTQKRGLRLDVGRAALEAAKLTRGDAERTLTLALKTLFNQALLARAQIDLSADARASAARTLELNEKRFALGAISEADVARAEVAELEAEQARDQAVAALQAARASLGYYVGLRGPAPEFELDPHGLDFKLPAALASASAESLLQAAIDARPDLKAAAQQGARAEAAVSLARRQRIPDVQLSAGYAQQGTSSDSIAPPTLSLGISLPLPIFYQQGGEIARAEADLRTQLATRQKLEAQVSADVRSAWATFTSSRAQVERMDARLLGRARRARDLIEIQYQKGAATLLDLLDAQRTFLSVNSERLNLLASYWTAVATLEAAVARELR